MELSLSEVSKKVGVPAAKILAWEDAGYILPLMQRRGRRLVRRYSEGTTSVITRVAELSKAGYRLRAAFRIACEEVKP